MRLLVVVVAVAAMLSALVPASSSGVGTAKDYFTVLPGMCPCASLNTVLSEVPDTPEGRAFISKFAAELSSKIGITIPSFVLDIMFDDASVLLDYMVLSPLDMLVIIAAANVAAQDGKLQPVKPTLPPVPSGFDVADMASFPINVSALMPPADPVVLIPGYLWQAYTPGNVSLDIVKDEVVMSLIWNQLAANNHLAPSNDTRFHVVYNGATWDSLDGLLGALAANGHTLRMWLTWRAVDFFGYLTYNATEQRFLSVPVPLFTSTGLRDPVTGQEAILPAIHNEYVIEIRPTSATKGTAFTGDLLWYSGDDGIGFFARDIYNVGSWVGTKNSEYVSGAEVVRLVRMMGVISDALVETARVNHFYDWGYGITGVCVDSTGIIEAMDFGGVSLYPLLMEKIFLQQELEVLRTRNPPLAPLYDSIAAALDQLDPDVYSNNPTSCRRALNSLAWPAGDAPFQVARDARAILTKICGTEKL